MKCSFKGCVNEAVAEVLKFIDNKDVQLGACEKFEGEATHWSLLSLTFDEELIKELFEI